MLEKAEAEESIRKRTMNRFIQLKQLKKLPMTVQ